VRLHPITASPVAGNWPPGLVYFRETAEQGRFATAGGQSAGRVGSDKSKKSGILTGKFGEKKLMVTGLVIVTAFAL
jgi:hypothetical protein